MLCILAIVLVFLSTSPANAGAWMREKGSGYSSTTLSATLLQDFSESTYLEYGVSDRLTLGAESNFYAFANGVQSGTAMIFLRRPIGRRDRPSVWAYELGIGAAWSGDIVRPNFRAGISWGRGYQLGRLSGWMTVDASLFIDTYYYYEDHAYKIYAEQIVKIDSTIGLNFNDRIAGMVQVFHAAAPDTRATSIAPSLVFKPLKNRPENRLQLGVETQLGNSDNSAFKISFWRDL
ncbi:hypothetical protein SAMN04488040_2530 [Sulfitobacter marinus]|uniref:YaiO family outer membrane beta-barrel protein n=1 Tax=Sulfitobacter marinus TaxID=394264 RepID=A0A1I6U6H1_9RHOB|nr:hypothetical protein [Sulfitobacter marinus]SFS96948.1 hypothetical protein SAMN04488040_2530 [Sulfitobacter marinus]